MKNQVRDAIDFFDADIATCTDSLAVHHWQTLKTAVLAQQTNNGATSSAGRCALPVCQGGAMRTITDQQFAGSDLLAKMVRDENKRQIEKWGVQTRTPAEWMLYLTEEVGELAEAISECEYRTGGNAAVVKEAIQAATLALKIAEMYGTGSTP